ncbi:MAG: dihydroorotase, partial [Gammaproteobacteria bacterium]|nr:dihydroorotase [Gammaproteobacteria bacterium]
NVDPFDREKVFIEDVLAPLLNQFSRLKVVLEHITTRDAVEFISQGPATLAATITPHHLLYNRGALFDNGLRPHLYCLPVL